MLTLAALGRLTLKKKMSLGRQQDAGTSLKSAEVMERCTDRLTRQHFDSLGCVEATLATDTRQEANIELWRLLHSSGVQRQAASFSLRALDLDCRMDWKGLDGLNFKMSDETRDVESNENAEEDDGIHDFIASVDDPLISSLDEYDTNDVTTSSHDAESSTEGELAKCQE